MELHIELQGTRIATEGQQVVTENDRIGMINYYNAHATAFNKLGLEKMPKIDPLAAITVEELQLVQGIIITRLMNELQNSSNEGQEEAH